MSDEEYLTMDSFSWMDDQGVLILRNSEENRYRTVRVDQGVGEELLPGAYVAVTDEETDEYADFAKQCLEYTEAEVDGVTIDYESIDAGLEDIEMLDTTLEVNGGEKEVYAGTGVFYALLGGGEVRVRGDLTAEQKALSYIADIHWEWIQADERDLDAEFTDVGSVEYEVAEVEREETYEELVFDEFASGEAPQQGLQTMMPAENVTWMMFDGPEEEEYRLQTVGDGGEMMWKEYQKNEGREGAFSDRALDDLNTYTPISLPVDLLERQDVDAEFFTTVVAQDDTIQPQEAIIELGDGARAAHIPVGLLMHYVPKVSERLNAHELSAEEVPGLQQGQAMQFVVPSGDSQGGVEEDDPDLDYIQ